MRRNTLSRIVALERSLAPGIDPVDRVILQVRASVSDGDLRIYARIEALPESERTQSEQAVFASCEQAYIDAFTLPAKLYTLALCNPQVVYNLFFQAVAETLLTIAADPRRLGARVGFMAVLHTWNQKPLYHPHLHWRSL